MNNDNNLNNNQSSNSDLAQFANMFSATIKESSAPPVPSLNHSNSNMDTNNSVSQTQDVTGINTIPSTPRQQNVISNPTIHSTEKGLPNTSSTVIPTPSKTPRVQQYGVGYNEVVGVKNPILSDDLLVSFIGENYQKFANNFFNWSAFFFGASYFFYRKLYLVGFIILILTNIFTNSLIGILVLGVVEGFVFYPIYRSWAMQKIDTIRTEKASLSHEEQRSFCIQAGGTSIPSIIMCFGINIVISLISFLISLIPIFS